MHLVSALSIGLFVYYLYICTYNINKIEFQNISVLPNAIVIYKILEENQTILNFCMSICLHFCFSGLISRTAESTCSGL